MTKMVKYHNLLFAVSFLFLIGLSSLVSGATYYVSTTGSDSNPGTLAQPFRTIIHAYNTRAAPNVTIIVMPGTYTDYTSGWGLHFNKIGSASQPIVLRSEVKGQAIIDGQNAADRNQAIYLDGSYNIIDGFEIKGGSDGGIAVYGNSNQIVNNDIHNNGNLASTSTFGRDGVYSDQTTQGNIYMGNYIHDNGRSGSNLDHGLYLCGDNEVVINNLLVRNAAYGLHIAGYSTVSNMKIYNNVIAYNGKSGIILWMAVNGIDIKNNILYANGHTGIDSFDSHGSGVVADNNIVFGNGLGNYDFTRGVSDYIYTLGSTISAEPLFVDSARNTFDAHLTLLSPALNAGLDLSAIFASDIDGLVRPQGLAWDIGAYEFNILSSVNGACGVINGLCIFGVLNDITDNSSTYLWNCNGISGGTTAVCSLPIPIVSVLFVNDGTILPVQIGATNFTINNSGNYLLKGLVNSSNENTNSFYIDIDSNPGNNDTFGATRIWDILPYTSSFEYRNISWRGNGNFSFAQYSPKLFNLSSGMHTLYINQREAGTQIQQITFALQSATVQSLGDLNNDRVVNILDLTIITQDWGKTNGFNSIADQNNDNTINLLDIMAVVQYWGRTY